MENVKGLLSAKINGSNIFNHILEDLHDPLTALANCDCSRTAGYKYKIHSFVKSTSFPFEGNKVDFTPADYLIMSEDYGIPQARHRVILLGIREDMDDIRPENLSKRDNRVSTEAVLKGLPGCEVVLHVRNDTFANWEDRVSEIMTMGFLTPFTMNMKEMYGTA